jgi:hypothetical protein
MATKHDFHKVVIGRSELLAFADAGVVDVPAKVDTGAYRSAVHAANITVDKSGILSFDLLAGHPICGAINYHISTKDFEKVSVTNSFGHREERYNVRLKVKLGPKIFQAHFTLADRSKMIFPILLGRGLLNYRFLVDSSRTSINRAKLKQEYGIEFPLTAEKEWA